MRGRFDIRNVFKISVPVFDQLRLAGWTESSDLEQMVNGRGELKRFQGRMGVDAQILTLVSNSYMLRAPFRR